jgi:preprotein translocase subunit SecF
MTSVTTLIAVFSLLFIAGDVLRGFSLALAIGVFVGTYSSIFVATPLLTIWEERDQRNRERLSAGRPAKRASA